MTADPISAIRDDIHAMREQIVITASAQSCQEVRWHEISRAMDGIRFWLACLAVLVVVTPLMMEVMR